jgi:hypothetical protein
VGVGGLGGGTAPPRDTPLRRAGPWLTLPACVLEAGAGGVVARAWPLAGAIRHPTAPPPQVAGGVEARLTAPRGPAAALALPPADGQAVHRGDVPGHGDTRRSSARGSGTLHGAGLPSPGEGASRPDAGSVPAQGTSCAAFGTEAGSPLHNYTMRDPFVRLSL